MKKGFRILKFKKDRPIFEVKDVNKSFDGRPILKKLSLKVFPGECVGILGPNGCGKTTLFQMCIGEQNTEGGKIYLNNKAIEQIPIHLRSKEGLGYLPQQRTVFNMSVYDNILGIAQISIKNSQDQQAITEKLLDEWKQRVLDDDLFEPQAAYGYFTCHNRDDKLVVDGQNDESVSFDFPRSTKTKHLCLTDYFGNDDIVAFQAVTVGTKAAELIEKWDKEDKYTDSYYLHGLAVETAEAMAEWLNKKIKEELGLHDKGGLRYSWGYPSCPDTTQQHLVWKLIHGEKSGMELTESGQIIPEQSTAAIVVHHPEAEYFVL